MLWSETTTTWRNKPVAHEEISRQFIPESKEGSYIIFDITNYSKEVQNMVATSLTLKDLETAYGPWISFSSREGPHKPYIEVTYIP